MALFQIKGPQGALIGSVDEWRKHAPPKQEAHWRDGRSAKELARAWVRDNVAAVPDELRHFLDGHPLTRGFAPEVGLAEHVTALDDYRGEHRNTDLLLIGRVGAQRVVVAIEAKADEELGPPVGEYAASRDRAESNVPARVESLLRALFGLGDDPGLRALRYQLVHGAAAALIEAQAHRAALAVFVVHEFLDPTQVKEANVRRNAADVEMFVRALARHSGPVVVDGISGPFTVPGGGRVPAALPLLVGKVTTRLAHVSAAARRE